MKMHPNHLSTVAGIVAVLKANLSGWYLLLALLLFSVLFSGCSRSEQASVKSMQTLTGFTTESTTAAVAESII